MNSYLSVYLPAQTSVARFSQNLFISFFFEILNSNRNLEAEKSEKRNFAEKVQDGIKIEFYQVFLKFCHYFLL